MRYPFLALVVLLSAGSMFAILLSLSQRPSRRGSNATSAMSQSFDAGELRAGQALRHTFTVVNSSQKPLKILEVQKSCGCVFVGAFPKSMEPGQTADITVEIDTRGMYGRFAQRVVAVVEEGAPIVLALSGTAIASHPELVDFGKTLRGSGAHQEIEIKALDSEPVSIGGLEFDHQMFDVEVMPSPNNSRDQLLHVTLRPDVPYGNFRATLTFKQGVVDAPVRSEIRLRGYVFKPVEAEPQRVLFGILGENESAERTIRVFSPYGGNVVLRNVVAGPGLTCASPKQEDGSVEIPITLKGGFSSSIFQGSVKIEAESGGKPMNIEVECYAMRAE